MSGDGSLFTFNWQATVTAEMDFTLQQVMDALATARCSPRDRARAGQIAGAIWYSNEPGNMDRRNEDRAFLYRVLARKTSLLPDVTYDVPGLHAEQAGPDTVTALEVTVPR